ncbi:MAG: hypothetical protein IJL96_11300 [Clostridia bacterium]|nr:hypothetical protein [Clostridia bacterium]
MQIDVLDFDELHDNCKYQNLQERQNRIIAGMILIYIGIRFPVFFQDQEITGIGWDTESTVETVRLFSKKAKHICFATSIVLPHEKHPICCSAFQKAEQQTGCFFYLKGQDNIRTINLNDRIIG